MAKVLLRLRTFDGETPEGYPICWYIRYAGKPFYRRTGYYSSKKDWNQEKNTLRAGHPKGKHLVNYLNQEQLQLQIDLTKAEAAGLTFKEAIRSTEDLPSFTRHFEQRIKELHQAGDLGNMRFYTQQLNFLKQNLGAVIEFSQLDYGSLQRLVAFSEGLGHSYNTIRQRIQTIKAVYNNAVKRYPEKIPALDFSGLLAGRSAPRSMGREIQHQGLEDLQRIFSYTPKSKAHLRALDVWRLAFLLQGAGVIDVLYFDPKKVSLGYYPLKRLKMPKKDITIYVLINSLADQILKRHAKKGQPYAFDLLNRPRNAREILPGKKLPEGTRQYDNARTIIDRNLKRVSKDLDLAKPLSMIQARHSWVILARDLGTPKEIIQQCIGHQGQAVIDRHYFGQYDQERLDAVNLAVLNAVCSK